MVTSKTAPSRSKRYKPPNDGSPSQPNISSSADTKTALIKDAGGLHHRIPGAHLRVRANRTSYQGVLLPEYDPIPNSLIQLARSAVQVSGTNGLMRRDGLNGSLLEGTVLGGPFQIPRLERIDAKPLSLVAFSEIDNFDDLSGCWIHFYEFDSEFYECWLDPKSLLRKVKNAVNNKGAEGIIGLDISTFSNMPLAQQIGNTYQSQLIATWVQRSGIQVIGNVRIPNRDSVPWSTAGFAIGGTIALATHGCIHSLSNRSRVREAIQYTVDILRPERIIVYGSDNYRLFDYARSKGIEVCVYPSDCRTRSTQRRAG